LHERQTVRSHDRALAKQDSCAQQAISAEGIDRTLPAGSYWVVTDEELIEEISFPVWRRVATMIFVPAPTHGASSIEMVTIDPLDLRIETHRRDKIN
jgi:hypothetical protein